jgi:hypothetical protein
MQTLTIENYSEVANVASTVSMKWFEWNSYKEPAGSLWSEIDKYIHGTDTNSTLNTGTDHNTMIPVVSEIHNDLNAIMYSTILPHEDWLGWQGYDIESVTKTKREKVLSYIKHIHRVNNFRPTMRKVIDDYHRYGNCFAKVYYKDTTTVNEKGVPVSGYSGACIERISPFDIVFNPTANSFYNTGKIIRSLMSLGEFKSWIDYLPSDLNIDMAKIESVLDRRSSGGRNDYSNRRKEAQYIPDGFGSIEQYLMSDFIEVLTYYGDVYDASSKTVYKNRCIAIVDRDCLIFDKEETGVRVFKGSFKQRPDNLWAQGALDNVVGINYMINHRENAKNDAIDRFAHPDRLYVGDVEEIYDDVTGQTKYLVPEGGSVSDITPDSTVLSYNNEIALHLDLARRASGLPPQISGFRTAGEKTAFEVQNLNEGAFRSFINSAEQFEQEFLEPLITAEIEIAKENFTSVIKVLEEDEEGIFTTLQVTEDDLKSNGKLVPYGARRFERQLQQQAGIQQLSQSQLGQLVAPHMNSWQLTQAVNFLYGLSDFDIFGKFAATEEQLEQQKITARAEEDFMMDRSQPSMAELELGEEL